MRALAYRVDFRNFDADDIVRLRNLRGCLTKALAIAEMCTNPFW
jgi:hypothetical protein